MIEVEKCYGINLKNKVGKVDEELGSGAMCIVSKAVI